VVKVANPDRYLPKSEPVDRTSSKMTTQTMAFIDGIIESDRKINRKQCHTSRRIWERVVEEFGEDSSPAELTVRRYVGKVKKRSPEPERSW
jgi:hypothetical protein